MLKLSDFAHCDDDTEKRLVVQPRCDGYPLEVRCGAPGEKLYTTPEGRVEHLCPLHYYKLLCISSWDEKGKP
jgi:hypothetical protein